MALPTSTIVMAVLTCIPFGLAIRDTVTGKPSVARTGSEYDSHDDDEYEDEYARANAERAAEEAAEAASERLAEAKKEQLRVARSALFGAEVATLGSGFAGITLGMPETAIRSETVSALETATALHIEPMAIDAALAWILIEPKDSASEDDGAELCSKLGQDLQDAWGRGQTEDYQSRYWVNPVTRTRTALLASSGCGVHFERYAEPKDWVSKAKTSIVPILLVGQSFAKLREHLGGEEFEESDVTWLGVGVGVGSGETRFQAHVVKGKVVAITAAADTFDATREEVVAQLTTLYGAPTEDDDGHVHWKKTAIEVDDYEGAGIRVTIGKIPDYK